MLMTKQLVSINMGVLI